MVKLKNVIRHLSEDAYRTLHDLLRKNGAEKSAYLLSFLREKKATDMKLMKELRLSNNAYYTLRSRLGQKINNYLMSKMEGSRARLLKRVASTYDMVFTHKPTLAIATLKKLEKKLIQYDLPNELAIVYKHLRRLHLHDAESENYKKCYNKQVDYSLFIDRIEDKVADYFCLYGQYYLSHKAQDKQKLISLEKEIRSSSASYNSHRLYVYASLSTLFHRLYVVSEEAYMSENKSQSVESVEDNLQHVHALVDEHQEDPIYHHLKSVFNYLQLSYYHQYGTLRKTYETFFSIREQLPQLLNSYKSFSFPEHALFIWLNFHLRQKTSLGLLEENKRLFSDYEVFPSDTPHYAATMTYQALCHYYAQNYGEAVRLIQQFLNRTQLKKYPRAFVELKMLLCLQYAMMGEEQTLFVNLQSVQRKLRVLTEPKAYTKAVQSLLKVLRVFLSIGRKSRKERMLKHCEEVHFPANYNYSPLSMIRLDADFVEEMCRVKRNV